MNQEYPYEVYHKDGEGIPPKFKTWAEAIAKQAEWNKQISGHKARIRLISK